MESEQSEEAEVDGFLRDGGVVVLRDVKIRDGFQGVGLRLGRGVVGRETVPDLEEVFGKDLFWKRVPVDPDPFSNRTQVGRGV